jgi:hypothetical protein
MFMGIACVYFSNHNLLNAEYIYLLIKVNSLAVESDVLLIRSSVGLFHVQTCWRRICKVLHPKARLAVLTNKKQDIFD